MIRQTLIQTVKPTLRTPIPIYRTITSTALRMAEGDVGSIRSGGAAQGDAFSKREEASENRYVREKEMEKLKALKDKIAEQKKHLDTLDASVSEQMNNGGKEGK